MTKRVKRSKKERMVAGVCGGFAEYFHIDPSIVRLIFLALSPIYGGGLIAYALCAILIPEEGEDENADEKEKKQE